MESSLYLRIGKKIRKIRQGNKNTLIEIANKAGVSKGLLSMIENGRTIPSLPVLLQIIKALGTDLTIFFEGISDEKSYAYIHKREEDYTPEEKEDSEGFDYFSIVSENIQNLAFLQCSILKLTPKAKREKVVTNGFTFLYLISGNIEYVLDNELILLKEGDSLFFDGKIPHVPHNNSDKMAKLLIIYLLTETSN